MIDPASSSSDAATRFVHGPALAIIIPVFNERENITAVLDEALEVTEPVGAEIIVVDDGSTDGTADAAEAVIDHGNRLRVIRHPKQSGKSAALRTGALAARAIWMGTMDGDGQDDPRDLLALANEIDFAKIAEVGLVGGVRQKRTDGTARKYVSAAGNGIRRAILRDDCPDTACGLKVLPRDLFLAMPFFDALHRYLPAFTQHFGYKSAYVPVTNRPRASGTSKYTNLGRAVAGFFDLMGVAWLLRRSRIPAPALLLRPDEASTHTQAAEQKSAAS